MNRRQFFMQAALAATVLGNIPGLAAAGPVLPGGMAITLPDPATTPAANRPTVNLWD